MSNLKSKLLHELNERGFIYQASNLESLDNLLNTKKIKAYIGFDCTANSLHVGSLLQIMLFKHLQLHGHTPVVLLGGGTSLVGDPSGKDASRKMLTKEDIEFNKQGIKAVLSKFIDFDDNSTNSAILLDNASWLTEFNYLDFLRSYGTQFTINRMLTFDSVKLRLEREQPLTFLEFNYMLLQAVDFLYLYKNHDVVLQLGGSDQWGNIINGVELIRRNCSKEAFALTSPLLTTSTGAKMGKSENGAVWLSSDKISTWEYYQFWRNVTDLDVIKFLKLYTFLPLNEINELAKLQGQELNTAKKILAFEATKLCFGEQEALAAANIAITTFEQKSLSEDLPTINLNKQELTKDSGVLLVDFLAINNIVKSKSEARKLIQNKGLRINDIIIEDINILLNEQNVNSSNQAIKLSIGKKSHYLIKIIS
ncbi:tyrosine--tRNA ligase [Rickettsiales bacterium LUAb2]